jgi:hypothetical protein
MTDSNAERPRTTTERASPEPLVETLLAPFRRFAATASSGVTWRTLAGAGVLGGIGFTMALFIASLAFEEAALLEAAKLGVFAASAIAGGVGWLLLRRSPSDPPSPSVGSAVTPEEGSLSPKTT